MKKFLLILSLIPIAIVAQRKKNKPIIEEVKFSLEPNVRVMKAFGDNVMNKGLSPFVGFGLAGNMEMYKGFGFGGEYNYMTANLNKDNLGSLFGYMTAPTMNNYEFYAFYKHNIGTDLYVEGLSGLSIYRINSKYIDKGGNFKEGNTGYHIGGKLIYSIDGYGTQQVVLGTKLNYYSASIRNDNPEIEKFYSNAWFVNLSLAYRVNF